MTSKKIIILGAGLSGLSAALHLREKGMMPASYEKEGSVGGLCRSKQCGDFTFDYDGHLLHFRSQYAFELIKKLLKENLSCHKRSAWIDNFGRLTPYPFQANLHALPERIANECLRGFLTICNTRSSGDGKNFLSWIKANLGEGIAKHFMVPYNEKFWNFPLKRMASSSWTDKFIPQVYLYDIITGFFGKPDADLGYNSFFWYPKKGGIGKLALAFEKKAGHVQKNSPVSAIDFRKKEITVNGRQDKFDRLVLTIPLPELLKIARAVPPQLYKSLKQLRWNSIFNLNLAVKGSLYPGKHWIYFPEKKTSFFRLGFYHNFSDQAARTKNSSLYIEVSYTKESPIDKKRIVNRILKDLREKKIISRRNKILAIDENDISYGYPIYDRNYSVSTKRIKNYLAARGVIACGRYGSWKYMSMEDSILAGKDAANLICQDV